MKKYTLISILLCFSLVFSLSLQADEAEYGETGFGFDSKQEDTSTFHYTIGGEIIAGGSLFWSDIQKSQQYAPGLPIAAKLHLHTEAPLAEAVIRVCLNDKTLPIGLGKPETTFPAAPQVPQWLDELYLKLLLGPVVLSGGIQKITWGRAAVLSVLDTVNPLDKTIEPVFDSQAVKIARPLFSAIAYLPRSVKLEGVFIPVFEGHRIALSGRLEHPDSRRIRMQYTNASSLALEPATTNTIAYAQGGGRCSFTVLDVHDAGVQYFYGRLPDVTITKQNGILHPHYDPYHHLGIDYGTAIGPVNLWAEAGLSLTDDIYGDNPAVRNSFFEWNTGLEYRAPRGFTFHTVAVQRIIIHHTNIRNAFDAEYGSTATDTVFFARLSQTLIRGALTWTLAGSVTAENTAICLSPGLQWILGSFTVNCTTSLFTGKKTSLNPDPFSKSVAKLSVSYRF